MGKFTNFSNFMQQHVVISERMALREKLLLQTDAVLARKGYSRELIEQGLSSWPWQAPASPVSTPDQAAVHTASPVMPSDLIRQAARALNRYTGHASVNDEAVDSASRAPRRDEDTLAA